MFDLKPSIVPLLGTEKFCLVVDLNGALTTGRNLHSAGPRDSRESIAILSLYAYADTKRCVAIVGYADRSLLLLVG